MVRNLLLVGGLGVAAYIGYRWWTGRQIADAANTAPTTVAGGSASSMVDTAARTTIFGGGSVSKGLLGIIGGARRPIGIKPTAPATLAAVQSSTWSGTRGMVMAAVLGAQPVAPSPSSQIVSSVGIVAPGKTAPTGDQPGPGSPPPPIISMRGILN